MNHALAYWLNPEDPMLLFCVLGLALLLDCRRLLTRALADREQ